MMKKYLNSILDMNLPKPHIGEVFEFKDLLRAVRKFQSGQTTGKIIVKVD